jgi:hypothetical protein
MKPYLNFFTILGLLFLGGAGIAFYLGESMRSRAELTTGTVTGFSVQVDSEDNSQTYCPQVTYRTRSGEQRRYDSNFCSSPAAYDVGEQVELYYDPNDPDSAQIKGFWSQYLVVTLFACMGLPLTGLGVWIGMPAKKSGGPKK